MGDDRWEDNDAGNPLDATLLSDGDTGFFSLDNRRQPEVLEPGVVQTANNIRMNQRVAQVRKGLSKQTQSIVFSVAAIVGPGLIVPFTVSDGGGIFGACLFSDPVANNQEYIMLATTNQAYLFTPGMGLVSIAYPANELVAATDQVDLFEVNGFVYLIRGDLDVTEAVASLTSSSTTATLTTSTAHGYVTNQWVQISGSNFANYNGVFQITKTGATTFTYAMAGTATSPSTGTIILNRVKPPLKWNGSQSAAFVALPLGIISAGSDRIYMPASDFGMLQVNRAFLQYARNEVIISDIDNAESYDSLYGVFTFAQGWSDYLIGTHPYQDNQTLVFLRRSVYLLNNVDGDVAAVTDQLLTQQVGCISRRSIATCGSNVLFLSDMGVFMLQPGYELTLRGNWEPLSAPISTTIQSINFSAIQSAVAAYWNNRYYLAVPVGASTRNNMVLVYNFINQAWESIDSFPSGFYVDYMVVMNLNNFATLYLVNQEGGIYAAEQNELDDYGVTNPPTQYLINGDLRTRRLTFGNNNVKTFSRVTASFSLDANASFQVTAHTIAPTADLVLPGVNTALTAGAADPRLTRRLIIKKRGYGIEMEFHNTAQGGAIQGYTVSGYTSDKKSITLT